MFFPGCAPTTIFTTVLKRTLHRSALISTGLSWPTMGTPSEILILQKSLTDQYLLLNVCLACKLEFYVSKHLGKKRIALYPNGLCP